AARSRRRRLHRSVRHRARDVDRARHTGPRLLPRPGVVVHDRGALPSVDHRHVLGAGVARVPVRLAAPAPHPQLLAHLTPMQQPWPSDRSMGDLLVDRRVLTLKQLDEATALAEKWHVRLGDAILARNWVEPAAYYRAVAFHYSLPFVDFVSERPD